MKIEELTPGFRVYDVTYGDFNWYDYVCPMPVNDGLYFIFINKRIEKPIRMYKDEVQKLLNNGIFTLEDCLDKQIELAEKHVEFLKQKRSRNE